VIEKTTLMKEINFTRVYLRGLLFQQIGMSYDILNFSVVIDMTENYIQAEIASDDLPGEKELKMSLTNFDISEQDQ